MSAINYNEIFNGKFAKIFTLTIVYTLAKAFHSAINLEDFLIMIKIGYIKIFAPYLKIRLSL